jgi:hypothetical protein
MHPPDWKDLPKNRLPDTEIGKVAERTWYTSHQHIFPACKWELFEPDKTYEKPIRLEKPPGVPIMMRRRKKEAIQAKVAKRLGNPVPVKQTSDNATSSATKK